MSEAKVKVRAAALALGQFTSAQVQRSTGLNPSSIQTELQRMKRDGLLAVVESPPDGRGRVGAPKTYEVVAEPSALQQLVASIEAYSTTSATPERPTSREYEEVRALLDRALVATPERRVELLRDAAERLEAAEEAELAPLASREVQAYLRFERARLSFLREEYELAERALHEVSLVFADVEPRMEQLANELQRTLAAARDVRRSRRRRRVRMPVPVRERVVVQPASRQVTTRSGPVIPATASASATAKEKPQRGTVVAVGHGRRGDDRNRIAAAVEVGDMVLFAKHAGTEFQFEDEEYLILSEKDILAIIED